MRCLNVRQFSLGHAFRLRFTRLGGTDGEALIRSQSYVCSPVRKIVSPNEGLLGEEGVMLE